MKNVWMLFNWGNFVFLAFVWISHAHKIHWTPQPWKEANFLCSEQHQHLSIIRNFETFANLTIGINATGDMTFWIGGKERRKYFIWDRDQSKLVGEPIGCFETELELADKFVDNQPTLCMSYCLHRLRLPFAGLSGNKCMCYHDLYNTLQVRDRKCSTPCPGDDNYTCGGSNLTTVYRTDGSIKWRMYEPGNASKREDCVLVTQDQDQQAIWYTDRCHHQHNYICKLFDETICKHIGKPDLPCYFKSFGQATWYEAVRKCSAMRGYLAGKGIVDQNDLLINKTSYWTSLNRVRQRWSDGTLLDKLLPRSESHAPSRTQCLSLSRVNDEWRIQTRSCQEQHPAICDEERKGSSDFTLASSISKQGRHILQDILIGVAGAIVAVCLLILALCYCVRKQKKNKIASNPQDHFYFILEKESVYNTISLESRCHMTSEKTSDKTYYDVLAFEGTAEYTIREKSISGQAPVDYYVYNRITDVTEDYDVLHFTSSKQNAFQTTDDYFKIKDLGDRHDN